MKTSSNQLLAWCPFSWWNSRTTITQVFVTRNTNARHPHQRHKLNKNHEYKNVEIRQNEQRIALARNSRRRREERRLHRPMRGFLQLAPLFRAAVISQAVGGAAAQQTWMQFPTGPLGHRLTASHPYMATKRWHTRISPNHSSQFAKLPKNVSTYIFKNK